MDRLITLYCLSLLLINLANAVASKSCPNYFNAEGCNLLVPQSLNNANSSCCKPNYCSKPKEDPLLLNITFNIIGMKYLPDETTPFSYYQISME